jgi:hypothetical protein
MDNENNGIMGIQERRYEWEGISKKANDHGKSEGIILEGSGFKKERTRILGVRETI